MTTIRPLVHRALDAAGLLEIATRVLQGELPSPADLVRLHDADVLAVAALADAVRESQQGEVVLLVDLGMSDESELDGITWARPVLGASEGATGLDVLREVALVRVSTPAERAVAVSFDALGEGLAQAALTFGASVLVGTLTRRATLPLAENAAAQSKRADLLGCVLRAGRQARWLDAPSADAHTRSATTGVSP